MILCFWCIIFSLYRRMRYCKNVDDDGDEENNNNNKNDTNNTNVHEDGVRTVECGKETKIYPGE